MRSTAPLAVLLFAACPKDKDDTGGPGAVLPTVEIPRSWESREAAVVMRLTNASSTSTNVRRALNELFNDAEDPIDALDLLMRAPEKDPATGELMPVDTSLSTAELLAGSSLEQAAAFRAQVLNGGGGPFTREQAVDACGNEMIATVLSPHALQTVFPEGPQGLPVWPASCPDGADCQTATFGTWDVALGEMRFDGMIDMVLNIFPDVQTDPVTPGAWGHLSSFFLSTNNPGFNVVPLFANVRRVQVNLTGVWQLDRSYADPVGVREVFKFPHRSRTLTQSDVFVFLEGYAKPGLFWEASGLAPEQPQPFGFEQEVPIGLDLSAPAGEQIYNYAGPDEALLKTLEDVVAYQIGAAIACPSVREPSYAKLGPVEFFLCPDVDLATCVAREDIEEGACMWQADEVPTPADPFAVTLGRVPVLSPTTPVELPAAQVPSYIASPAPGVEVKVQLDVNPDSVLYLLQPGRVVSITSQTGLPVALPAPVANTHCTDSAVQRFDVGTAWQAGTYEVTLDFAADPDGTPGNGDELMSEIGVGGTTYNVWMYFTSVDAWTP